MKEWNTILGDYPCLVVLSLLQAPCVVPLYREDSLLGVFTVDVFHKFLSFTISQDLLGISSFSLGMVQDTGTCVRRVPLIPG